MLGRVCPAAWALHWIWSCQLLWARQLLLEPLLAGRPRLVHGCCFLAAAATGAKASQAPPWMSLAR